MKNVFPLYFGSLFGSVFISVFLGFVSFSVSAQINKNQSLLWEITGNGLKAPSYLYGTMHVSNKIAFNLGDTFFLALDKADVIALESDPGEWMEEMFATKSSMLLNGYRDYLDFETDKNFYKLLASAENPDKKALISALRDKHSLQNGFLYRSSFSEDEFEESTYLDLFIYQYGKKNKKKVLNLEEMEETNILQIKSMIPDPKLDEAKTKEKEKGKKDYDAQWDENKTVAEALEDAYRDGNITVIDSIMKMTSYSDNYLKYFLYERNKNMVRRIDSLLKFNKLFIGIGAAHLPGKEGVIEMLREKGFQLRPVTRTITDFAKNKKNNIEETFLPVAFKPSTTKDGYISVNVPGKLYETPGENGDIQYFFPEMINGGFFLISRFNTFTPLQQFKPKHWQEKIDSLLFENIEGKIVSEKKITINGYEAIDVVNKTRKGDFQRRVIVFTPLEIIFFKMSGTGEWVKLYGDEFFNSIKFNRQELKSTEYISHLNDYSIKFPVPPIHNVHAEEISDPQRHCVQAFNPSDSAYFSLFSGYINDFNYIEEDTFELGYIIKTFYEQFDSAKVENIFVDTLSNKFASGKAIHKGKTIYTKAYLHRNFYFLLVAQSNEKKALDYFSSFNYTGKFKENEFKWYEDSVLMCKVKTPVVPEKMEDLLKSSNYIRTNFNNNTWDAISKDRYFENENNKESILVHRYKYPDYVNWKNLNEYWKDELEKYQDNGLIILQEKLDNNDTLPSAHVIMSDTNSSKRVEVKKYLKQNVLYTIKTTYDSSVPKSAFISTFFESFQLLKDTIKGRSMFENTANLFFSDLRSMDSLRVLKAVELVEKVSFEKEHIDSLIWFINNYKFPENDKEETKVYLIRELGYVKSASVDSHLTTIFENGDADSKVQFAALKGLAKAGNKKSFKLLSKLLTENPPVTSNDNDVVALFRYFDDSLALSKLIYPKSLDLLLYNEYREPLYDFVAMLLDSGLISPKSYKKINPLLIREAKGLSQNKKTNNFSMSFKEKSFYYNGPNKVFFKANVIDQFKITPYLKLLAPHYKKDKNVQRIFNKILVSDDNKLRVIATVLLAKEKVMVQDSIYQVLSNSPEFCSFFYKALEKENLEKLFIRTNLNQEKFAKSIIYSNTSMEPKEDSIRFVKKVKFNQAENNGYIYFYKSENSYNNKWEIHYAGIQPKDSTAISSKIDMDFIDDNVSVYNEIDIDKEIDKIVKGIYLRNRKRAWD